MLLVFAIVGALLVFAIAAAFVGSEAFRLGHTPTTTVFDLDEAVLHVAENLSVESAMGLTMEEVRDLIRFSLEHLRSRGLSAMPGEELDLVERAPVVLADDEAVAVVLGRADEVGMEVTDVAVYEVLGLLLDHLVRIGAVGPAVPPPEI
ncbi:MAG TPA: hypothetical protein VGE43_17240 [Acidimicrobiales bacterium]